MKYFHSFVVKNHGFPAHKTTISGFNACFTKDLRQPSQHKTRCCPVASHCARRVLQPRNWRKNRAVFSWWLEEITVKLGIKIDVDLSRNGKQWKTKIEIEAKSQICWLQTGSMHILHRQKMPRLSPMLIDVGSTYVHHHGAPNGFHSSAGEIQTTGAKYDPAPFDHNKYGPTSNSHQFCSIVTVPFQIIKRIGGLSLSGWWFYPSWKIWKSMGLGSSHIWNGK